MKTGNHDLPLFDPPSSIHNLHKRVRSVAEIDGIAEEQVEEKVVLIEAETEKRGVDMLKMVEGGDEALEEEFLDLWSLPRLLERPCCRECSSPL
ncbi:hypothetical protein L484_002199 [Morus notabilis]|uniref:Uncharacterized protein n=1 Tax=Morus notabilis TaxID=981085 RepID=W9QM86_9ROSA|nr:hypothetical protein L484_002199 [Morus notabilis]